GARHGEGRLPQGQHPGWPRRSAGRFEPPAKRRAGVHGGRGDPVELRQEAGGVGWVGGLGQG
ncbi:MAG TPA: hypothetical protein VJ277_04235, partial [Gemmatimonadales bacterium]|nr:hypothetical protein [Gemmatimonadales bacterium]